MPRARFQEALFKRDKLGRFATKNGSAAGGKPRSRKPRPGVTNAQRREAGHKKLKAANTLRGHEDYAEKNDERVAAGKPELAGIGNTRKQLPTARERFAAASRAVDGLYLPYEEDRIAKEEIAKRIRDKWKPADRRTTTGKSGSSRNAKGLTKDQQDRIQLNARAKKVARERAKEDARPSSLRRRYIAATKKVGKIFDDMDFDAFKAMSEDEKDEFRKNKMSAVDEMMNLEEQLKNAKPDRSRKLSSATSRSELVDIMADRYPGLKMEGWDEPDGALEKELRQFDGRLDNATITKKCIQAFQSMDQQMQKYPEVKLELGFNAWAPSGFSNPNAIAHCRRGPFLAIDFNVRFLSIKNPAEGSPKEEGVLGFHPPNFHQRPWGNTVTHEFGHAVDWYANGFMDVFDKSEKIFRDEDEREKKGGRKARSRANIQEDMIQAIGIGRGTEMKKLIAGLFVDAGEPDLRDKDIIALTKGQQTPQNETKAKLKAYMKSQMSGYSFHPKTDAVMFDDEALAEAWMDVEHNGDGASDTSKALHQMMVDGLEGGKEGRARRLREKMIDSYMKLGLSRKDAEKAADGL